jgi:hypothetical protein
LGLTRVTQQVPELGLTRVTQQVPELA